MLYPDYEQPHIILNVGSSDSVDILKSGFCDGIPFTFMNARSGEEAIGICAVNQLVRLVLLRPELSGINGFETAAKIRETDLGIAIVMIAVNLSMSALRLATLVGCNEIIRQPVSSSELNALCKRYFKGLDSGVQEWGKDSLVKNQIHNI